MNILTDVLSLIRRGVFAKKAELNDVLILGVNEEPDMTGVASPIPYKSIKVIKVRDFKIAAEHCDNTNSPATPAAGTGQVYQKTEVDATTEKCTVYYRSLKSMSSNLTLALSSDDNYIELTTEGEPNLAANVGSGAGVWKDKNGETLRFKSIVQGTNITVGASTNEISLNVPKGAGLTLTTTGSSGASTLVSGVLNIPQYSGGGGGSMSTFLVGGDSGSFQNVYDGDSVDISGGFAIDTIGTSPTTVSVSWNKTEGLGYAQYVSNLSQANAAIPTEVVLENNTTRTLTWSYVGAGQYRAVFNAALVDIDKVTFDIAHHFKSGPSGVNIVASSVNGFTLQSFTPNTGTLTDSILSNTTLTFKIYP